MTLDVPIVAYADGSGTRAYLPCGAGVVIYEGERGGIDPDVPALLEASRHLGLGSNNHAELSAVRIALWLTTFPPFAGRPLIVRTDSDFAIGMVTGRYRCRETSPNRALTFLVRAALQDRDVRFEHVRGHEGILGNERADRLANLGRLRPTLPRSPDAPQAP